MIVNTGRVIMVWVTIIAAAFWGLIILYILARFQGFYRHRTTENISDVSSSEKLFNSKVYDAAFFDGESEQYAESLSRMRQYGGA